MITKAQKSGALLRLLMHGLSGGGKTLSSLRIATGIASVIGGRICLIDSENRRAMDYADRFDFDHSPLTDTSPEGYIKAIQECAQHKYPIIIIDSISHEWRYIDQWVQIKAQQKYRGNTWAAWSEGTPKHDAFMRAITEYPGHVICTARSETKWEIGKDNAGRAKPEAIGLKPTQRQGFEYEFNFRMSINRSHVAEIERVSDARSGDDGFQDKTIEKPGEDFGKALASWLNNGVRPVAAARPSAAGATTSAAPNLPNLVALIEQHGIADMTVMEWCIKFQVARLEELSGQQIQKIIEAIDKKYGAVTAQEKNELLLA